MRFWSLPLTRLWLITHLWTHLHDQKLPAAEGNDDSLASLLQTSHYLDMFNDVARNRAYRLALEAAIQAGHASAIKRLPHSFSPNWSKCPHWTAIPCVSIWTCCFAHSHGQIECEAKSTIFWFLVLRVSIQVRKVPPEGHSWCRLNAQPSELICEYGAWTTDSTVLDIGTGTGLLAMLAARVLEEKNGQQISGKIWVWKILLSRFPLFLSLPMCRWALYSHWLSNALSCICKVRHMLSCPNSNSEARRSREVLRYAGLSFVLARCCVFYWGYLGNIVILAESQSFYRSGCCMWAFCADGHGCWTSHWKEWLQQSNKCAYQKIGRDCCRWDPA